MKIKIGLVDYDGGDSCEVFVEMFQGNPAEVKQWLFQQGDDHARDFILKSGGVPSDEVRGHNTPSERWQHCCHKAILEASVGQYAVADEWLERSKLIKGSHGQLSVYNWVEAAELTGRNLLELRLWYDFVKFCQEVGLEEKVLRVILERKCGFKFEEPESVRVKRLYFDYIDEQHYVLFENGVCYIHLCKISVEEIASGGIHCKSPFGFSVGGATSYVVQPNRNDWVIPFVQWARGAGVSAMPVLRALMEKDPSVFGSDSRKNLDDEKRDLPDDYAESVQEENPEVMEDLASCPQVRVFLKGRFPNGNPASGIFRVLLEK